MQQILKSYCYGRNGKSKKGKTDCVSEPHEMSDISDHSGKDGTETEQVG